MSTTVNQVYQIVCRTLLEPNGFVLGVFSEARFLDALAVVLLDWAQRTGLTKHIYTEMISAGVSEYIVPDAIMEPQLCFVGGKLIEKTTDAELNQNHFEWKRQWDVPRQWHEDSLAPKRIELYPIPNYNGTNIPGGQPPYGKYVDGSGNPDFFPSERNLTIVGPAAPSKNTWALGDTLDAIEDCFVHYLAYGILAQIFSADGETKDVARGHYARARYEEGVSLAKALAAEELLDEEEE